jgi:hypothetical protein
MTTLRTLTLTVCWILSGTQHTLMAQAPVGHASGNDPVLYWNDVALQACIDDHSGTHGPADQGGPTRTSRALAIVHLAIYDAVNAIVGGYEPYIAVNVSSKVLKAASVDAAVAQAAHDTLASLYPSQAGVFAGHLQKALKKVNAKKGRAQGVQVGALAAANILLARSNDGGDTPDEMWDRPDDKTIGVHREDPENVGQGLLTPRWGYVTPFAIHFDICDDHVNDCDDHVHQAEYVAYPPPKPDSDDIDERLEYAEAYEEVMRLGGDGVNTPTERTKEGTEIGLFWAYDGAIGLGVPPRFYNQITRVICRSERNSVAENARLFALVNMAQADAGIVSWYNKYHYDYWRPIVGIRCGDEDDNEFTIGDENWTPLGAPATNQSNGGIDFTPPFPAYTSGHATFGAAMFRTLANFYGTDEYRFRLISDEMHGRTKDAKGKNRYTAVRTFNSFSEAAWENAYSRIYLGIHWIFDAEEGVRTGNNVADFAFDNYLRPVK